METSLKSNRRQEHRWRRRRHTSYIRHVFPVVCNNGSTPNAVHLLMHIGFVVLVALSYCVNDIDAFNLENRLPIVKHGENGTYFGYSVAGHVTEKDDLKVEKW